MMNDEGWWIQAVERFWLQTNRLTDKQTFVIVESLLRLKTIQHSDAVTFLFWNVPFGFGHTIYFWLCCSCKFVPHIKLCWSSIGFRYLICLQCDQFIKHTSPSNMCSNTLQFLTFLEPSWVQNQRWKWTISVCYFSFVCIILHPTSVLSLQISTLHSKSCLEYASVLGILNFDKFSKETQAWWLGIMFAFTLYKCILSRLW